MTMEEAVRNIKALNAVCWQKDFYGEEFAKSLALAIKSLDAWNKVIEEIENHRRKTKSIDKYDLVGDCLDIIKNYMKEVDK